MLQRSVENPEEARTDLALLEYSELERRRQLKIKVLALIAWSTLLGGGLVLSALAVIYA